MNKKVYIILLIVSLLTLAEQQAKGQEYPWMLQYQTNMHTINPAYVGLYDMAGFQISTRKDYTTIQGATSYQQFSFRTPIKDHNSGVGVNLIQRKVGLEKQLYLTFDYSYQMRLDMYYYLRFGFRAGVVNYSNDLTDYHLYPDHIPDSQFATDINNYFMTVFGFGAVIFNDNYYVSLSVPQVINNTFKVNREGYSSLAQFKTAYLSSGYVFRLPLSMLIRPNLLVVGTIGKPVYFDASALLYFPGNLQLGLNLRSNGSTCMSAQFTFRNNLRIGFAADYALIQDIKKFQAGTYEIMIGYDYNVYRKKAYRPNYF
jgi:type IX secretion system PorP/SprF family membrane protein